MLTRKIQRAMWKRDPRRGSWRSWCKRMGLARGKRMPPQGGALNAAIPAKEQWSLASLPAVSPCPVETTDAGAP